eukprot:scaffold190752_cov31-Attheya_sp.AAC.1
MPHLFGRPVDPWTRRIYSNFSLGRGQTSGHSDDNLEVLRHIPIVQMYESEGLLAKAEHCGGSECGR